MPTMLIEQKLWCGESLKDEKGKLDIQNNIELDKTKNIVVPRSGNAYLLIEMG